MTLGLGAPVEAVATRVLSVPLDPMIVTPLYDIPSIEMVLLRVRDRDGAEGTGCLWCFGTRQAAVLVAMLELLARPLLETAAESLDAVLGRLHREVNFLGYEGVSVFGLAACDMALHDLVLRRDRRSLSDLLGRRRDAVPVYWSGLFANQPAEALGDEVDAYRAAGFGAFKVRLGRPDLREDIARVETVLAHAAGLPVMADAVQAWSRERARRAMSALSGHGLHWLEDPLVHDDHHGVAELLDSAPVPIATGENAYLPAAFERLLHAGCPYLLADLQRAGGIAGWRAVADIAGAHGACLTPHVYPHVAVQLCAALDQPETWLEHVPWWDPLVEEPLQIADGAARVPDAPGIGLRLDAERVDAYALASWQEAA